MSRAFNTASMTNEYQYKQPTRSGKSTDAHTSKHRTSTDSQWAHYTVHGLHETGATTTMLPRSVRSTAAATSPSSGLVLPPVLIPCEALRPLRSLSYPIYTHTAER